MDTKYLHQIKNFSLENQLLRRDNISAIEYILNQESQRLKRLQQLKAEYKLDFDQEISREGLDCLFPQVCQEVNALLDITEPHELPPCGYFSLFPNNRLSATILSFYGLSTYELLSSSTFFSSQHLDLDISSLLLGIGYAGIAFNIHQIGKASHYNAYLNKITLHKIARTDLIPNAGHEYAHYVQQKRGMPMVADFFIFAEGHARGIQRQVARIYQEREDNEAFLYGISDKTVGELKSTYIWICKQLGQQSQQSLLNTKTTRDHSENLSRLLFKKPSSHAIGNSLFSIYEAKHGPSIYAPALQENFEFI